MRFEKVGGFRKLVADGSTVFAIRNDGSVYSWIPESHGDREILGLGAEAYPRFLQRVPGLTDVVDVTIDVGCAFATTSEGSVFAWGRGDSLGLGERRSASTPARISGLAAIRRLDAHIGHVTAITVDGGLYAWGKDAGGGLGLGDTDSSPEPSRVEVGAGVLQVLRPYRESHGRTYFATTEHREVFGWGSNIGNVLGPNSPGHGSAPVLLGGLPGAKEVMDRGGGMLAVSADDFLYGWGKAAQHSGGLSASNPTQFNDLPAVRQLTGFGTVTYVVGSDGSVWTWGQSERGLLGLGGVTAVEHPTRIPDLHGVTKLFLGEGGVHALTSDGRVWAWGLNTRGQLGLDHGEPIATPALMALSGIRDIFKWAHCRFAVDNSGGVYSWGDNRLGILGTGSEAKVASPELIRGLHPVRGLHFLGYNSATALTTSGDVYSWGLNAGGQLGVGSRSLVEARPRRLVNLTGAVSFHRNLGLCWALTSAGSIFRWGSRDANALLVARRLS